MTSTRTYSYSPVFRAIEIASIISFVVFMITKALLKEKPAPAGPATKTCRECGETVLASARQCTWCGSALS